MSRLIDADWIFAHLWTYDPSDEEWNVTGGTALRLIHKAVDNAPTVDADLVVEAEWVIGDKMPSYPRIPYQSNRHYCSACEMPAVAYEHDRYDIEEFLTPRCPECGAYMQNGG
jgi:hypothetical protein